MSRIKWSKELILKKIQELETQGVNFGGGSIQKTNRSLYSAGCRLFGNWSSACEEAGVLVPANPKVTTAEVLKVFEPPQEDQVSQSNKAYEDFRIITPDYEEYTRKLTWRLIGTIGLASDPFSFIPEKTGVNVKVFNGWLRGSETMGYDDMVTIGKYLRELAQ
ncbi:hypothetical protein P4493_22795 [Bacillus thuringiensis]|uniref:Uncharacterized protein n=3 Tax=Bacillus thuringiensis TaxID=1428 RepID=A0AB35P8S6_BACTU|nr:MULTISPECIES: hypothetical protein [Bacillus]MED1157348.1 hypothetical protein [Bacillus paranthracis]HDR7376647.1 hypothetical protein [Bacillus toyonensis]AFQ25792.1 hypothetical protein BTF1_07905 [Bacillus thuringiensis HD-789]AJH05565.1 hypothetical protein AS86_1907 [Bacillus thuringiensis HD1002]AND23962.1 hypothetical protein ATN07_10430 [Bacillus thuringiensis serovar israelensis]